MALSTLRQVYRLAKEARASHYGATARHIRIDAYSLIHRRHPELSAGEMVRVVKRLFDGERS